MLPPLVGVIHTLAWLRLTIVASIFVTVICELAVFATGLPPLPRDVDLHQPDNERGTTPIVDVGGVQPLVAYRGGTGSTPGLRRLGSPPGSAITRTLRMQGVSNPEVGYRKM